MVSTVPREYPAVYQKVTHGSSRNSWLPCARLNLKTLSPFPDLWSSRSGTDPAGLTMQKVRSPHTLSFGISKLILSGKGFSSHQIQNPRPFSPSLVLQTSTRARHT